MRTLSVTLNLHVSSIHSWRHLISTQPFPRFWIQSVFKRENLVDDSSSNQLMFPVLFQSPSIGIHLRSNNSVFILLPQNPYLKYLSSFLLLPILASCLALSYHLQKFSKLSTTPKFNYGSKKNSLQASNNPSISLNTDYFWNVFHHLPFCPAISQHFCIIPDTEQTPGLGPHTPGMNLQPKRQNSSLFLYLPLANTSYFQLSAPL